ncbi:MAG TPA: hypothetical protein PKI63_06990 [Candidatus Cloacimonadota bacterium]|nr:hypothetical protein [Candidatus Cloacimonadota bacterium]
MKRLFCLLSVLLILMMPLSARSSFSAQFIPSQVFLNELRPAIFNPDQPESQPLLTTLQITNNSPDAVYLAMKLEIMWNDTSIISKEFVSKEPVSSGLWYPLTNADLINSTGSGHFNDISDDEIDFLEVIEGNQVLKDAALSGYFPDGDLKFQISLKDSILARNYDDPVTFVARVRNTGVIHLITPGNRIGNIPSQVSMKPVSFVWNAVDTGYNKAWITIREYPPNIQPNSGSVASTGTVIYETPDATAAADLARSFNFAEFLAFNEDHYYAWQITMDKYDEFNLLNLDPPSRRSKSPTGINTISSIWNVFRYVSDASSQQVSNELQAILNQLNNLGIQNLFNSGYVPTGLINTEGRNYTGTEAVRKVEEIMDKELDIRLED